MKLHDAEEGLQASATQCPAPTTAHTRTWTSYWRVPGREESIEYAARFCASRLRAAAGPARVEKKTLPRDAATPARQWRKSSAGSLGCLSEGTQTGKIVCWSAGAGAGAGGGA